MRMRVKFLLAGMVLVVAAWRPAPAEAWCTTQPHLADTGGRVRAVLL
jgi:hypothetical protein